MDRQMKARPHSVMVIAWVLIVQGLIAIGLTPLVWRMVFQKAHRIEELMARSSIPLPVQIVLSLLGVLVTLASGAGVFYGRNWGRVLYVTWSVIRFLLGLATSPMKPSMVRMVPGLVLFLVVVFVLFRKRASRYFAGTERTPIPEIAAPDPGGQDVSGLTDEQLERRTLRWHGAGLLLALGNLAAVFLGVFVVDLPVDDYSLGMFLFTLFLLCVGHGLLALVYRLVTGVLGLALPPLRRYGGLGTIAIAVLPWAEWLALNVLAVTGPRPW
jgi:hypothetical protein